MKEAVTVRDSSTALGMTEGGVGMIEGGVGRTEGAGVQNHEAVGVVCAAEFGYAGGVAVLLHVAAAAVKDHKVVSGAGKNI